MLSCSQIAKNSISGFSGIFLIFNFQPILKEPGNFSKLNYGKRTPRSDENTSNKLFSRKTLFHNSNILKRPFSRIHYDLVCKIARNLSTSLSNRSFVKLVNNRITGNKCGIFQSIKPYLCTCTYLI